MVGNRYIADLAIAYVLKNAWGHMGGKIYQQTFYGFPHILRLPHYGCGRPFFLRITQLILII